MCFKLCNALTELKHISNQGAAQGVVPTTYRTIMATIAKAEDQQSSQMATGTMTESMREQVYSLLFGMLSKPCFAGISLQAKT